MIARLRDLTFFRMKCRSVLAGRTMIRFQIFLVGSWLTFSAPPSGIAAEQQRFEAAAAELVGGASKVADGAASGGSLVGLTNPGDGIEFTKLAGGEQIGDSLRVRNEWHDQRRGQRPAGAQGERSFLGGAHQFRSQRDH